MTLVTVTFDDYSQSFSKVRGSLANSEGVRYLDFVRTLTPIYWRVYLDIGLRYAGWIAVVVAACVAQREGVAWFIIVPPAAILIALFSPAVHVHEAAHWNIAPDRKWNDLLCNVLMSWIIGLEIKFYREIHFDHHRHLGTARDTERSYFSTLNTTFVVKGLTFITLLQTLRGYTHRQQGSLAMFASGGIIHGSIVLGLLYFGYFAASLAWVIAILLLMPLIGSVRQILEHRTEDACSDVDYSAVDQGACTRLFGDSLPAKLLGASGFNHHLVHHWEPQVPYTRLTELERFLDATPMRDVLDRRRTTYRATFRQLFR
jgi:fatty acid desaturase